MLGIESVDKTKKYFIISNLICYLFCEEKVWLQGLPLSTVLTTKITGQ